MPRPPFPARPRRVLWPALLLVCGAIWALTLGAAIAQSPDETVAIRGRVVNGTAGFAVPDDATVLMLITGADGALAGTGQTLAAPDGGFAFDDAPLVAGGSYTLSLDYAGVFYGLTLAAADLAAGGGDDVVITVYEPTEDAGIIIVDRQVMVITDFDAPQRMATATEFVRFRNPTDRTLQANLETAGPGMFSFMRFALPPGAADVTVQSNLRGGEVISVGSGFALTAAVPPGEHSVDFAYRFPYGGGDAGGGGVAYRNSLPQGVGIFQILVPERWDTVEISGLSPRPPVGIQEGVYRAWEGRDIPAGQGVQLRLAGLPQPGLPARIGGTLSGAGFWLAAIPSGMGAALLALLLLGLFRRSRAAAADPAGYDGGGADAAAPDAAAHPASYNAAAPDAAAQRRALVAAIAALDDSYQRGDLEEADYRARRAELAALALGLTPGDPAAADAIAGDVDAKDKDDDGEVR